MIVEKKKLTNGRYLNNKEMIKQEGNKRAFSLIADKFSSTLHKATFTAITYHPVSVWDVTAAFESKQLLVGSPAAFEEIFRQ